MENNSIKANKANIGLMLHKEMYKHEVLKEVRSKII